MSNRVLLQVVVAVALIGHPLTLAQQPPARMPSRIGPTDIRCYSGNLSVGLFRKYWGTVPPQGNEDPITPEKIAQLKRCSCTAMCDYITWCTVERQPGQWDWSFYQHNARMLKAAGLQYNVFCWLHFPPRWFLESERFTGYQNLATGRTIPQLSLWSPETLRIYDEFYARMAAELGKYIDFVRLAMPSEYGEIGYCTGMTKWLVPQEAAEPGFWCGDVHARASFREWALRRHGNLDGVNRAWGTSFRGANDMAMPDPAASAADIARTPQSLTRWLDFNEWYQQSWTDLMTSSVRIVRKHFPRTEIILSLGYGAEAPAYGNDQGRFIKAMAELKVAAQTPGAIGYFATRRVSSACRAYEVPYFTEPPGGVSRDKQVERIWMDASNGTQTWFDYLGNMDQARDLFVRYKRHLNGRPPVCGLALWLPTWHQYMHPGEGWPRLLGAAADELRDLCDYEVVDDHMLANDALEGLNIRVLAMPEAACVSKTALQGVERWVEAGGVLISFVGTPPVVRGGEQSDWQNLVGGPRPSAEDLVEVRIIDPVPAAYSFATADHSARAYLIGKWFGPDGSGPEAIHWCGQAGGLRLPVEPGRAYRVLLRVGVPGQAGKVRIRAGDTYIHELAPGTESAEFELPSTLTSNTGYVDLVFEGQTWRPSDVQDSGDSRQLMIHVQTVKVQRLDTGQAEFMPAPAIEQAWRFDHVWETCGRPLGKGRVITVPLESRSPAVLADLVAHYNHHLGKYGPYTSERLVDGSRDGVWATAFADYVLYYNTSKDLVSKRVEIQSPGTEGQAPAGSRTLRIKPGEIVKLDLPK